jgi:ATP-dependent helicase/nuclease subunit A
MQPNELVIYKSSAGSGKTFTLVLEYLKLLLKSPSSYRSILAVTFTNKATEEMKTRIIKALVAVAGGKNDELTKKVLEKTGLTAEQAQERAKTSLDYILHDFSGFSVSTIDSFFSKILRTLARELQLPLRFDMELDTDSVIREITNMLLDDIGTDKWLRKWLGDFVMEKLSAGEGWKIEPQIHLIAKELFKERYRILHPDKNAGPTGEFLNALLKIKSEFQNYMKSEGETVCKLIQDHGLAVEDFAYGKGGPAGYFVKICNSTGKEDDYLPGTRFLGALDNIESWSSKKNPRRSEVMSIAEKELIKRANFIYTHYQKKFPEYVGAVNVLKTIYLSGLINSLDLKLRQYRDENKLVLISDTNMLLHRAISGEDAPFLYEKSGNRYKHFMLDEFQDTSDFQWSNLLPLVENALGSGNYTMIVGDAKQSIYRWRGGNMQLLLSGVQKNLEQFKTLTRLEVLSSNFRSRELIVDFNNRFFEYAASLLSLESEKETIDNAYHSKDLKQKFERGLPGEGYVAVRFLENGTRDDDAEENEESEIISGWKALSLSYTLETLHRLYENNYQPRDIAILVRSNREGKEIISYLMEHGITRIISPDSMLLKQSTAVMFLISAMQFVHDTANQVALAHMVYFYQGTVKGKSVLNHHELFALQKSGLKKMLPDEFSSRVESMKKMPLYDLTEELCRIFELNKQPEAYIQRFHDLVLEFSAKYQSGLGDFLEWWEENKEKETCSVVIPSGENALRVMTIHKSKGLQFPVVIIPFCDWKLNPQSNDIIWLTSDQLPFNMLPAHPLKPVKSLDNSVFSEGYRKEIEKSHIDSLNLLYVAFTRAEENLFIFSPDCKTEKISKASQLFKSAMMADSEWRTALDAPAKFLEIGKMFSRSEIHSEKGDETTALTSWLSNPWKERLWFSVSKRKISVSDPEIPDTTYGLLFHKIMSAINSEKDADALLNKYADSPFSEKLRNEIMQTLQLSKKYGWFDEQLEVVTEAELLVEDGTIVRPDRLILKGNKAVIIDYKTGPEESYHPDQLNNYASVLAKMGYNEIKMFLIYPASGTIREVTAA